MATGSWLRDFTAAADVVQSDGSVRKTWYRPLPLTTASQYGRLRTGPTAP